MFISVSGQVKQTTRLNPATSTIKMIFNMAYSLLSRSLSQLLKFKQLVDCYLSSASEIAISTGSETASFNNALSIWDI